MQSGTLGLVRARPQSGVYPPAPFSLASARLFNVPLPVAILLIAMIFPGELDFYIGTLRLNFQRLALIIWAPAALARLILGRGVTLRSFDYLLIAAFLYFAFATFVKEPVDRAIVAAGILLLEAVGGYLIARVYIRNEAQFLAVVKLLFCLTIFLGACAAAESISFDHVVRNFAARLVGAPQWAPGESRMGLLRAMVSFDHPIHYGVFCTSVFALAWFTEPNLLRRLMRAAVIVAAAFFSLSSAPLLGIGVVLAGAVWERVTRSIPNRAWLTIFIVGVLYFLLALLSNRSPFRVLVTSFVFDPGNAWYRMLIIDYGIDNVLNNPWFGVSLGFWERPAWMPNDTLDNYWLAIAVWGGLPSLVLYALSIVGLLRAVHNQPKTGDPGLRRARYAWTAALLTLCLIGGTVHYWGIMGVYFVFCLGMGSWLIRATGRRPAPSLRAKKMQSEAEAGASR